jgi:hypothetical protein
LASGSLTSGVEQGEAAAASAKKAKRGDEDDWLDVNTVNKAQRTWRTAVGKLRSGLESLKVDADELMNKVSKENLGSNAHFKNPHGLLEHRMKAVLFVMGDDAAKLQEYAASFGMPSAGSGTLDFAGASHISTYRFGVFGNVSDVIRRNVGSISP